MGKYNGWHNYETWNVALHLSNSWITWQSITEFMQKYKGRKPYRDFCELYELEGQRTIDGVMYLSDKINLREMNSFMWEAKHG